MPGSCCASGSRKETIDLGKTRGLDEPVGPYEQKTHRNRRNKQLMNECGGFGSCPAVNISQEVDFQTESDASMNNRKPDLFFS